MSKKYLILFFIVATPISLVSQDTQGFTFPAESNGFIEVLSNYLSSSASQKTTIAEFTSFNESYQPEENEWISLANTANALCRDESQPTPTFLRFIQGCISFQSSTLDRLSFSHWLNELYGMLAEPSPSLIQIETVIQFANGLNRNQQLFSSSSIEWKLNASALSLKTDSLLYLSFQNGTLTGIAGRENATINGLSGKYYPIHQLLDGNRGTVNWESVGINQEDVFAQLNTYQLDLSKSVFTIDSVLLNDKRYFRHPVLGRLEHKASSGLPANRRGYPKFISYDRVNPIKNIFPNMDYSGGFTLQGNKVIGADMLSSRGTLIIFQNNRPVMRLGSTYFLFTETRARGVNAEVSIYLEQDSIFHPGLSFQYQQKINEVALMRDGLGLSNSRFFNTFHNLDLDVEMITWHPGDTLMVMSGMVGSLENQAHFESADYFSVQRYNEIQVADWQNPLVGIKRCATYYNSRIYTAGDLAEFLKKPHHAVAETLLKLSFLGFVRYDTQTDVVEVTQRCYDFLEKHAEKQDYDIIRFQSDIPPPTPNGYILLKTKELMINGVRSINFSTVRGVVAYPNRRQVRVGQNRAIRFDGRVKGGLLDFVGTGFELQYPEYGLYVDHVEKINLKVHIPLNEDYTETYVTDISSVIENTRGKLYIDAPNNKSGVRYEDYPQYPWFIADTSAFVYYDQSFVQGGVYRRDSFYFSTNQLSLPGLNSVYLKDSLSFHGQFKTAGIFPTVQVDLGYREDHSLGFETLYTPDSGYSIYQGKGRFYNEIKMSNEGLVGDGVLEYLDATLVSDHFLFLPDELQTVAKVISVEADPTAKGKPATTGAEIDISWDPFNDQMLATPKDSLLQIYEGVAFDGEMQIEPDGIRGNGTLSMQDFEITSSDFQFFKQSIVAENSEFNLFSTFLDSTQQNKIPEKDLTATDFRIRVDFVNHFLKGEPETDGAKINFHQNRFSTRGSEFNWTIGEDQVDLMSGQFHSEKADHEGLNFNGSAGTFDRSNYILQANQVDSILIADAIIIPGQDFLTIRSNAHIDSINSCRIKSANDLNHQFVNAVVKLRGKNHYLAAGQFVYTDIAERNLFIPFTDIRVKNGTTVAKGQVKPTDQFFLSPEFAYKGDVSFIMNKKLLDFDGYFQLTHDCISVTKKWVQVKATIDPKDVVIPIAPKLKDDSNEVIHSGFLLSNQPIKLYSSFLGPHTRYSDASVLETSGLLWFDYDTESYLIAENRPNNGTALIPRTSLGRNNCVVDGEGKINFGVDLGQVTLQSAGTLSHELTSDSVTLNTMTGIDFFMNDKAMNYVAKSLNSINGARPINYSDIMTQRALLHFTGQNEGEKILNQLSLMGGFKKLPALFEHSILFSKLDLAWNNERGSYQSVGQIGISNIMDKPVNKLFNGHLEISHRRGGDSFTLYIETSPGNYFFFYYNRGLLQVLASPEFEKFNEMVRSTKESKRKSSAEGSVPYQYYIGQYRLVRSFLDQFN